MQTSVIIREHAVFMAGTQILDEALISFAYKQ